MRVGGIITLLCFQIAGHAKNHISFTGEFVYMRRTEMQNKTLVNDANKPQCPNRCPHYRVMSTDDLVHDFEFEPGYRVGFMLLPMGRNSIEGNFLYLHPWHGSSTKYGDASLSFPFKSSDYAYDFVNASKAHGEYESKFWDAELNYWRNFGGKRDANYFALSGIVGLRYFQLHESFKLIMTKPPDQSAYHIRTENKLPAAQLGLDFQMNPTRFLTWEAFVKGGIAANHTEQHQFLGDINNTSVVRNTGSSKWDVTLFADVMAEVGFHFGRHFFLHGGYQMMCLTGLSLAPEQISTNVGSRAGKTDHTEGTAIIHGLFAGLTISF